jgi:hypothetical protein
MAAGQDAGAPARTLPKPLPEHPGNVFLAGEEVVVSLPREGTAPWRVLDYDGKLVAEDKEPGKIALGKLPVGYYEIPREDGKPLIGIGVLAPLAAPTPKTSPIGVDAAVPWSLGNKLPEAASLCALAGINWARGRLNWTQMEPKQGQFSPANNYDAAARELHKAGIQVLQVNHHTPQWAGQKNNRFPTDLRDAYRFYREMAQRWQGQVQAFEPWNEADWPQFGGHTGAEMASFQKACYWGLKAGNPDMIVCQNVFANYFEQVISDFHDNEAWPYFDTLNFHHYWSLDRMPKYYSQFREISGGRPLWVTECNFIRGLSAEGLAADEKLHDFTTEIARQQAAHVLQTFAVSIQGGSVATFWFMFPHYSEGPTQFGVLRADLTPRPGYLALAAAGRLLADAQPVGRLKSDNKDFWGYLFRARPDGKEQLVLIGWTVKGTEAITLPSAPTALFDTIGREQTPAGTTLEITPAPVLGLFPVSLQNQFAYDPAPAMPPRAEEKPSPVVLQAVWPAEKSTWPWVVGLHSHYWIGSDGPERMPIGVYNFGDHEAKGRLTVTGPKDWKVGIPHEVTVKPMERVELALTYDLSQAARRTRAAVKIEGDFGPAGRSLLSLRLLPLLPAKPRAVRDRPALLDAKRWQGSGPREAKFTVAAVPEGILVELDRSGTSQKWFSVSLNLDPPERPANGENALLLPVKILEGEASLSVRLAEEKGRSYSVPYGMGERARSDDGAISFGAAVSPWTMSEPQRTLDPQQLRTVQIGGEAKTAKLKFLITKVGWATF